MGGPLSAYARLFEHGFRRLDAERAHHLGMTAIRTARPALARRSLPGSPVRALGLEFPNVLGLAAGFDKNAVAIDALAGLGFGHVEIGTVTGQPQPGNPQPRLFRLPNDRAVVNRMGFNNDGAAAVAERLARRDGGDAVLGVNIGKTKVVPEDDEPAVLDDYGRSAGLLAPHADYLVVNVSSPNTPGLRSLQAVDRLRPLLDHVRTVADRSAGRPVPLLVKIAPDLADDDVVAVADLALELGLEGVVATNTTISRAGLRSHPDQVEAVGAGGLSGRPLAVRATAVTRLLRERLGPDPTIIGVGGVTTADDARERLAAGADLLQAYTAFVYEGPGWPRRLVSALDLQETRA